MRPRTVVCVAAILWSAILASAGDRVLVVHSYHEGYPWADSITEGIRKGFEEENVEVEFFYMDTKRRTSEAWKREAGARARERLASFKPRVVITCDDNAQEYFAKEYAGKADAPQFVFCGVNAEASIYGFPAANVTGVLERPHVVQSIEMLRKIDPGIKKVAIIADKSPSSDAVVAYVKSRNLPVELVSIDQPVTFDEWKATVRRYQDTVDAFGVIMYHTVKASPQDEQSLEPSRVVSWTVENNRKPTFALLPLAVNDGILCGIVESGLEHGYEAARITAGILGGKKAPDFSVRTARRGEIMFNVKTAEKIGIKIPFALLQAADVVVE